MNTDLAIIIPTFNERPNVRPLLAKLHAALDGIEWEAIFVDDDSPDGTADEVRAVAMEDNRVRCIQRIGRRGLSSACIEGFCATPAAHYAVIDGDLQHDEALLPHMLAEFRKGGCDMVIGSRYVTGGSVGEWNAVRLFMSRFATKLAHFLARSKITDPMSGFFMLRREVFDTVARRLSGMGFKILLDILASSPGALSIRELPYKFRPRHAGESKLDAMVLFEYVLLLVDKTIGRILPLRFLLFVMAGCFGAAFHLGILGILSQIAGVDFWSSQAIASVCAMFVNFFLNNTFTFSDLKLKKSAMFGGLVLFLLICSLGGLINVLIANNIYDHGISWWLSGLLGAVVGSLWNFGVSSQFVWRPRRRAAKPPVAK